MMPDQPASLHHRMRDEATRADSFSHGSVSGRHMPDDPATITHINRSNDSGSDHTVEAPRTPMSSHSHARAVCYNFCLFICLFSDSHLSGFYAHAGWLPGEDSY
jgi:hypothetical protein